VHITGVINNKCIGQDHKIIITTWITKAKAKLHHWGITSS